MSRLQAVTKDLNINTVYIIIRSGCKSWRWVSAGETLVISYVQKDFRSIFSLS